MATKAQMESQIEQLRGQLASTQNELKSAHARIDAMRNPEPVKVSVPKTCINCGQGIAPIKVTQSGYACSMCGHNWTDKEELAPFRRG